MKKLSLLLACAAIVLTVSGCGSKKETKKEDFSQKCRDSYNCVLQNDGSYSCLYSKYDIDTGFDYEHQEKIKCKADEITEDNEVKMYAGE